MNAVTSLFGRARTDAEVINDIQAAAQRLSVATRSWSTIQPQRAAIDEALSTCLGLSRVLAELHGRVEPQRAA
jgi:hypothetical protein